MTRIPRELYQFRSQAKGDVLQLQPEGDDLTKLYAVISGPKGTGYEGGKWKISIQVPQAYPNAAPVMRFVTPVCHPNVHFTTGEICLDLLNTGTDGKWTPAYTLVTALEAIVQLLAAGAEPDSPLNVDIAKLLREGDYVAAEGLIKYYTNLYAK
ncbi:ubiquitin-conjugating enzyme [Piedraia hortae CBS 480.64]|uniref:Ubiquitin-conjugating enzyme n=1 Tax=Piedraia hortae CBS 480.64 TaxID=1314780 RepID=A0A6A7C5K8_9PEZI|nr:ubiquitin-conjugating enzyme [Piedraia hortae CBS 480.64]